MVARIELEAHAKVNLTLEVLGKRDDGYHEIASIMQTISLHDTLTLAEADDIVLECDHPGLSLTGNLVLCAARLLKDETGFKMGAKLTLRKRIPVSAGLGGGSSDAAAALTGLSRLWGMDLTAEELMPLAARLGSDVPFFLHGGTAGTFGRGERVRPLPSVDLGWIVVLSPVIDVPDKTASLYSQIGPAHHTRGDLTRKLEARIRGGGDVPPQFLFNVFDEIARDAFPGLDAYWDTFRSLGAREIHLAGSGPSLFAPVSKREHGTAMELLMRHQHGWQAHLVSAWEPAEDGRP
jgi:4-diphosphocytidyl-2-C-methyl-D-erythritol kinase